MVAGGNGGNSPNQARSGGSGGGTFYKSGYPGSVNGSVIGDQTYPFSLQTSNFRGMKKAIHSYRNGRMK